MTTALATDAPAPTARPSSPYRLSFAGLLRSESIKLLTLRSPWWSVAIAAVLSFGVAALYAFSITQIPEEFRTGDDMSMTAVSAALMPTVLTTLVVTILGAIQATGEYSTGMIRSTLTAAPRRLDALAAKAIVLSAFVFVTGLVTILLTALVAAPILATVDVAIDLSRPGEWLLPFVLGAVSLVVFALIGLAAGFLVRNGAGAIAIAVGLIFVLPMIPAFFSMMPGTDWIMELARYLPTNASQDLMLPTEDIDRLRGGLALLGWTVAGLAAASVVLKTRDA